MIKGDKIILTKSMGVLHKIGTVCEVIDVSKEGVITFKVLDPNLKGLVGCMSFNEFEKYFELSDQRIDQTKKYEWNAWTIYTIEFYDLFDIKRVFVCKIRDNGKKVQLKAEINGKVFKAEAACHEEDEFNFNIGRQLAGYRFKKKFIDHQLKEQISKM